MTWTRISDGHFDRPEALRLSRSAQLLEIEARVWSNRALTDGLIPGTALRRLSGSTTLGEDVAELLDAELWTVTDQGDYLIPWDDQETAETVTARRRATRDRQRNYAKRGRLHAKGDHSECTERCPVKRARSANADTNGVSDSVSDGDANASPSPLPSLRKGEGRAGPQRAPAFGGPAGPTVVQFGPAPSITETARIKDGAGHDQ